MSPPDGVAVVPGEAPDIDAYLAARLYEYNEQATGYFDGQGFSAVRRDDSGVIQAGVSGYTWGGCCYVSYLWVAEAERGRGMGSALLEAAERYAQSRGCAVVVLATHTFQAPGFYERQGYEVQAVVRDSPLGYADIFMGKRLKSRESRSA